MVRTALVVLLLLLVTLLMTAVGLAVARSAQAADRTPAPTRVHVVLPGETLWGIATDLAPTQDPRDVVALLVQANHLPSSAVSAGQRLVLPPAAALPGAP